LISELYGQTCGDTLDEAQMQELLGRIFPDPDKGKIRRTRIMESAAIAAYPQQTDFPVVDVLLSDGAPQFRLLTREQALCWVHDGRLFVSGFLVVALILSFISYLINILSPASFARLRP
jgi:hypothetical protein